MDLAALAIGGLVASIVLVVLSIGLASSVETLRAGLADQRALGRGLLLIFGLFPAVALALALLPLGPAGRAGLLALAVSPLPPLLPIRQAKIGVKAEQALALQVSSALCALLVAPAFALLVTSLLGGDYGFDAAGMLRTLLVTVFVPLGLGLLLARLAPAQAQRAVPFLRTGAVVLMVLSALAALPRLVPLVLDAATPARVAAILVMLGIGIAAGHLLGGPTPQERGALALGVALRHPGVAIGLATAVTAAPRGETVGMVLLYFLLGFLVSTPYVLVARRRAQT